MASQASRYDSYSVDPKHKRKDYDELNVFVGYFILILAFAVSLITTFGSIKIIYRMGLEQDSGILEFSDDKLTINQDVKTNTLLLKDELRLRKLTGEQILLSASAKSQNKQAAIALKIDDIAMQAESYSFGELAEEDITFNLPKRLDHLSVIHKLKNVRQISAPSSMRRPSSSPTKYASNIDIVSDDDLELNGNLGLRVQSSQLHIISHNSVLLESKEEYLAIRSRSGLVLPSLNQDDENLVKKLNQSAGIPDSHQEAPIRYNLCINREDGLISRTLGNCPYLVS